MESEAESCRWAKKGRVAMHVIFGMVLNIIQNARNVDNQAAKGANLSRTKFIYLFHSRDIAFIHTGYVAKERQKRTSCRPRSVSYLTNETLYPLWCAGKSRGQECPLTKRGYENKRKRTNLAFAPRGLHISRLSNHPLVHSRGTSAIFIRPVRHHSPYIKETDKPPLPSGNWLTVPGYLLGSSLPMPLLSPLSASRSDNGAARGTWSSWPNVGRASTRHQIFFGSVSGIPWTASGPTGSVLRCGLWRSAPCPGRTPWGYLHGPMVGVPPLLRFPVLLRNLELMWAVDMALVSALSLPGTPECPLTHRISTGRPNAASRATQWWIRVA